MTIIIQDALNVLNSEDPVVCSPLGPIFNSELRAFLIRTLEEHERMRKDAASVKYIPVDSKLRDSNFRHPNDNEPRTDACLKALDDRGDNEGQGLDGYWKWGFAAGFNAAIDAQITKE